MPNHRLSRSALLVTMLLTASACASEQAPSPAPSALAAAVEPTAAPTTTAAGSTVEAAPCDPAGGSATDLPGWPLMAETDPAFLPLVMSSLLTAGPNRFLYNVLDDSYSQIAAEDVASRVDFYALERDPQTPYARAGAAYLPAGAGRGLYRAQVDFDCLGEWGAEVFVQAADGTWDSERLRFGVYPAGPTPAIGAPAPRSDSPTATTAAEAALISTDADPYLPAYEQTVAQAVTSGQPALIFFATPAFCQTGFCGPTVDLVKSVARDYVGRVVFVNVEPYQLRATENGLQPALSEEGQLQPVAAALEWGIPVEPYLFLVGADGRIFAKFEGIVGEDELRAAIEDALSA